MKRFLTILLAVSALSLIAFATAPNSEAQNALPSGSYQETCKNIRADKNGLYATCQKRDGSWKETSLGTDNFPCREIGNDNGDLICLDRFLEY